MEGECENLQTRSNKKEGFYTVLRNFHSCVLVLQNGTRVHLIDDTCTQNVENVNVQIWLY